MNDRTDAQPTAQEPSQAFLRFSHRTLEQRIAWHVDKAAENRAAEVSAPERTVAA